jgi:uncharacterized protein (TIGR00730 family)
MQTKITIPQAKLRCDIKKVAIFGSADVDELHPLYSEVFTVARYLAYHGKTIVNGGGPGVMDAATKGAQAAGGKTVVVTFYPTDMPEYEGRFTSNRADVEIKTATYVERMFGLLEEADIFICFQGGTGTLSEWSTAWLLSHLYYGNHKPIILYGEFWKKVMDVVDEHFFIGAKEHEVYRIVKDERELIHAISLFEEEMQSRCQLPHQHSPKISSSLPAAEPEPVPAVQPLPSSAQPAPAAPI